jgi:hypothetical protein
LKPVESARFQAKLLESLPPGEIRRAIEGQLERQRRFPLDTANALRGRLRREGFTIFKKGSKGISYVCAVKRKFRVQGQSFAESIGGLIGFIESNPMITMREVPLKLLGFALPSGSPPPPALAPAESAATVAPAAEPAPAGPAEPALTAEQQEKLKRVTMDLHWLVHEGYVTEFADGRLFTPSPMAEARVKATESAEGEEHDPENFPEVPAPVAAPEPVAPPPPASTKSVSPAPAPENAPPSAEPPAVPEPVAPPPPASTESVAPVPTPENALPSAEPIAAPVPPSTEAPARTAADTPPTTEPPASAGAA